MFGIFKRVPPPVAVNEHGISLLNGDHRRVIPWAAISAVHIVWDENPWGDPQFGRYNDVDWFLSQGVGQPKLTIADSSATRLVLESGFAKYLRGYVKLPADFEKTFEEHAGQRECWLKDAEA